jgi:hypothetical protein
VVTVDCGITGVAEARRARDLGLDLIITDHHAFADELPAADVLVHPRLPGTAYPFGGLWRRRRGLQARLGDRHAGERIEPRHPPAPRGAPAGDRPWPRSAPSPT